MTWACRNCGAISKKFEFMENHYRKEGEHELLQRCPICFIWAQPSEFDYVGENADDT